MKKSICFIVISLLFITAFSFGQELYNEEHGAFSTYLLGFYNVKKKNNTIFKVANPTPRGVNVLFAFYNANGIRQFCFEDSIPSNGMVEVNCLITLPKYINKQETSPKGIVKIISLIDSVEISLIDSIRTPKHGIVGIQQDYKRSRWIYNLVAETVLPSIPTEVLIANDFEELERIFNDCQSLSP